MFLRKWRSLSRRNEHSLQGLGRRSSRRSSGLRSARRTKTWPERSGKLALWNVNSNCRRSSKERRSRGKNSRGQWKKLSGSNGKEKSKPRRRRRNSGWPILLLRKKRTLSGKTKNWSPSSMQLMKEWRGLKPNSKTKPKPVLRNKSLKINKSKRRK